MKTRKVTRSAKFKTPEPQWTERELRKAIEDAQKVWGLRADETDRARRAEAIAKNDLRKVAGRYTKHWERKFMTKIRKADGKAAVELARLNAELKKKK